MRFRVPDGAAALPPELQAASSGNGVYTVSTDSPTRALHQLTTWALANGIELEELTVSHPTLEDLFIELVGDTGGGEE